MTTTTAMTKDIASKIDDLTHEFKNGYSDALKQRFWYKATDFTHEYNDKIEGSEDYVRKLALVKFIGVRADKKYRVNCVKKVIDVLEDLESKGYIRAFLLSLTGAPLINSEYTVFSYPALTPEGITYLEETYPLMNFSEGDIPPTLEEVQNFISKK